MIDENLIIYKNIISVKPFHLQFHMKILNVLVACSFTWEKIIISAATQIKNITKKKVESSWKINVSASTVPKFYAY